MFRLTVKLSAVHFHLIIWLESLDVSMALTWVIVVFIITPMDDDSVLIAF